MIMRNFRSFIFAIIAVIGTSAIGASAQEIVNASSVSGQQIQTQIYKKLRGLPRYSVFDHISAEVSGGTVILKGKVISLGTRTLAANVVKDIPGVTEVVNNIENLPSSPLDNSIRREAYRSFVSRGPGQYFATINPDVRIIVENGRLTLEGYVYRQSDSDMLYVLANGISGVFEVTNNLVVGKRSY